MIITTLDAELFLQRLFEQSRVAIWRERFVVVREECPTCHGAQLVEIEDRRGISSASLNQFFTARPCFTCDDGRVDVERCRYCGATAFYPFGSLRPLCDCDRDALLLTA